jgi:hypothetical protein
MHGHPERSEAESKDPVEVTPKGSAAGCLPPSHKAAARQAALLGMTEKIYGTES